MIYAEEVWQVRMMRTSKLKLSFAGPRTGFGSNDFRQFSYLGEVVIDAAIDSISGAGWMFV